MAEGRKARLQTWKEVASFFGKDERTVKRWEAERGLPIHRLPGAARSRIYAEVLELEEWLAGESGEDEAGPAAPPPRARPRKVFWAAGSLAALIVIGLAVAAWPRIFPPKGQDQPPPLAAQRLYLAGMDDWARRTPESLHRAVSEFDQATRIWPDYAEAYAGLANCYNLLREYTRTPASQAYPLARAAALHALRLNDRLSSAHAALAFVNAYWDWDPTAARREFERAIELDPRSDVSHHWFATFLSSRGEFAQSLSEFDKARRLNPTSLSIKADHGLILYEAGRRSEGMTLLREVERQDPDFLSPHRYLAGLALQAGRDEEYLQETETAARLLGDLDGLAAVRQARSDLASGGHAGMMNALLNERLREFRYGVATAYSVAHLYAMSGKTAQAVAYLQLAIDRREEDVVNVGVDFVWDGVRNAPWFRSVTARIKPTNRDSV
jgi:tetratricopeptide (TPR) repeat protein